VLAVEVIEQATFRVWQLGAMQIIRNGVYPLFKRPRWAGRCQRLYPTVPNPLCRRLLQNRQGWISDFGVQLLQTGSRLLLIPPAVRRSGIGTSCHLCSRWQLLRAS